MRLYIADMSTTDPLLRSFIDISEKSDFSIQNLPYGIFKHTSHNSRRVGVAIGDFILDLKILEERKYFESIINNSVFNKETLNDFMSLGFEVWSGVREIISSLLRDNSPIKDDLEFKSSCLFVQTECKMYLPVEVSEFTDFYSSYNHAFNVGSLIRGPENAIMENWKHIPIAYHGRSSSIILSGESIIRPLGQTKSSDKDTPDFGPTNRLDFELEMGFFIGVPNKLGERIRIDNAEKHIFGQVLVNDWSARDVQMWEYRPLGPFLSKNFATSISPWVVTLQALEPFKKAGIDQKPKPLGYLSLKGNNSYDIKLDVSIQSKNMSSPKIIGISNADNLYWNIFQQLAHHSVNGCRMRTGDLLGSGTISGVDLDERGCLLEMTLLGKKPISISETETRTFLEDYDTVIISGHCQGEGYRVGFGKVETEILPSNDFD